MEEKYTYGFKYHKGGVDLDFNISIKNAPDFLECLEKAAVDVKALLAKAEAEKEK